MAGILNIQLKPKLGDKEFNLNKVELFIKKYSDKKLDLVVLPEFFSTGVDHESFLNTPEDENGGETIKTICEYAKKYNVNIIAGTVIEGVNDATNSHRTFQGSVSQGVDNKLYNTSFAINRNGEIVDKYRKIHLFNYMGGTEGDRITPGDRLVVVDFDFAKVGLGICFDMRYPLHYKKLAQMGAEIIVLPTAWIVPNEVYDEPESRRFAVGTWEAMNKTRAYDNLIYAVSCNQCGNVDDKMSGLGHSMIVAPTSEVLANAKDDQGAIYADIDLEIVKYYKSIYPIANID